MNKLKFFVRQRKKTEGSLEKGKLSYEYLYYASEYIKQINNTSGAEIWDDERDEDKREGEIHEMNGNRNMIKSKCMLIICQINTQ